MQFVFRSVLTAVFLAMASVADAGPFEDGEAAYQRHDYTTALQVWRALADQGDALAQNALGVLYAQGQGVTQDYAEAVKWYSKAADQELAIAQCNLADMYRQGQGVTQDYA
jgi:TPR repeat protein